MGSAFGDRTPYPHRRVDGQRVEGGSRALSSRGNGRLRQQADQTGNVAAGDRKLSARRGLDRVVGPRTVGAGGQRELRAAVSETGTKRPRKSELLSSTCG